MEEKPQISQERQEILNRIKDNSILKGITISGGEPLCKQNIKKLDIILSSL